MHARSVESRASANRSGEGKVNCPSPNGTPNRRGRAGTPSPGFGVLLVGGGAQRRIQGQVAAQGIKGCGWAITRDAERPRLLLHHPDPLAKHANCCAILDGPPEYLSAL